MNRRAFLLGSAATLVTAPQAVRALPAAALLPLREGPTFLYAAMHLHPEWMDARFVFHHVESTCKFSEPQDPTTW